MKKQNFILGLALVAFGFMACDNENIQLNTNEPETEINLSYEEIFAEMATTLGVDVTFEAVEVFYGLCPEFTIPEFEIDRVTTRSVAVRESWDIDNSTTLRATTSLGESLTTIATPHMDNPNTMSYLVMSSSGKATSFVADIRFDEIKGTISFQLMEEMKPIDVVDIHGKRWNWEKFACDMSTGTIGLIYGGAVNGVIKGAVGGSKGSLAGGYWWSFRTNVGCWTK